MRRLWVSLESYLFSEVSLLPIALLRIGIGAIFLLCYAQFAPRYMDIFSPGGLGGVLGCAWLPERSYWAVYVLILLAALGTLAGFCTRTCLAALFILQSLMVLSAPTAFWGWGYMIRHFVLFLIFCSPGRYLSVDNFLASPGDRAVTAPKIAAFPLRMIQVQICFIYFVCSVNRLDSSIWWSGKALHRALAGPFGRFPSADWYGLYLVLAPLSLAGFFLEILGSILVFLGRLQKWLALGLIFLHLILELTTRVQYWQALMIFGLLTFLPEKWLRCAIPGEN